MVEAVVVVSVGLMSSDPFCVVCTVVVVIEIGTGVVCCCCWTC